MSHPAPVNNQVGASRLCLLMFPLDILLLYLLPY